MIVTCVVVAALAETASILLFAELTDNALQAGSPSAFWGPAGAWPGFAVLGCARTSRAAAPARPARTSNTPPAAPAHDVVTALPDGYDTPLAPGTATLSGGQLKRLTSGRTTGTHTELIARGGA